MDATALLNEIKSQLQGISERVAAQDAEIKRLSEPSYKNGKPSDILGGGAPNIRRGENTLGSRGYSFLKLLGYCAGVLDSAQARVEIDLHNKLSKVYYGLGYTKAGPNSILSPFSSTHMCIDELEPQMVHEVQSVVCAGVAGYDPDEVRNYRMKFWGREKALSWVDEAAGGALVAPPMMGELIALLRNNEALLAAGARDIGMQPQGRITFPRQTDATTAFWVGQSESIDESQPATGDVVFTAKKLGVRAKIPNELFRFATVSIEQFIREDIARVMALKLDKTLIDFVGSSVTPKGLLNYAGIQAHTASTTGANGDTLEPQDIGLMIGKVEERNATFRGWIMRPLLYNGLLNRRTDAITANDGKGPFVFNMFREWRDAMERERGIGTLEGYRAVKSTQVPNNRTKGAATNLTCLIGGDWNDFYIALGGVIEFLVANQGDTMVEKDQTVIRGIQYVDGGPAREASFIKCDQLVNQ